MGKKKSQEKGAADDIDALAEDIEKDLQSEYDFGESGGSGEVENYLGKKVSFQSDEGEELIGVVERQNGNEIKIKDADGEFWSAETEDVTVVDSDEGSDEDLGLADDDLEDLGLADEDPKPSKKKTSKKKSSSKPKAESKADKKKTSKKKSSKPKPKAEPKSEPKAEPKEDKKKTSKKSSSKPKADKKKTEGEKPKADSDDESVRGVKFRRMLPTKTIKGSKHKPREVDKETQKYKSMKVDLKRRGQQDAIKIQSFDAPYLIGGAHRLAIFEELDAEFPGQGWDMIECQADDMVEDEDDRLMAAILDNETRIAMHWLDLARSCARLVKGGKWTQGKIARALGITPSEVSRMMAALKLPKSTLEVARAAEDSVSAGVFFEMASAPASVVKELTTAIDKGKHVTMTDVRAMKKAEKDDKAGKSSSSGSDDETVAPPSSSRAPARAYTYRDLSKAEVGDYIGVRVHTDHVELRFHVEWDKKTFRGFDPAKEVAALFDAVYSEDQISLDSVKALQKAMLNAKSELAAGKETE